MRLFVAEYNDIKYLLNEHFLYYCYVILYCISDEEVHSLSFTFTVLQIIKKLFL